MAVTPRLMWKLAAGDDPSLSRNAKLLAHTLETYMNGDGDCFVLVSTLAEKMNVSPRAVQRARAELVDADGTISPQRRDSLESLPSGCRGRNDAYV